MVSRLSQVFQNRLPLAIVNGQLFRRFGFGAVAALSLSALMSTSPAQAHDRDFRPSMVVTHHASYFPGYFFR
jgi:hypothetical protein